MSSLGLVKEGSVIERVYYAVPEHYSQGQEYPTFLAAVRGALAKKERIIAEIIASYPPNWPDVDEIAAKTAKTKTVVDLRWVIRGPNGGSVDAVIERTNVDHLSVEHCDRMEAVGRKGAPMGT